MVYVRASRRRGGGGVHDGLASVPAVTAKRDATELEPAACSTRYPSEPICNSARRETPPRSRRRYLLVGVAAVVALYLARSAQASARDAAARERGASKRLDFVKRMQQMQEERKCTEEWKQVRSIRLQIGISDLNQIKFLAPFFIF